MRLAKASTILRLWFAVGLVTFVAIVLVGRRMLQSMLSDGGTDDDKDRPSGTKCNLTTDVVAFSARFAERQGLGNQLFNLASIVYVARLSGRRPAVVELRGGTIQLDAVFRLSDLERFDDPICSAASHSFTEARSLSYDVRIEHIAASFRSRRDSEASAVGKSIVLDGYFQSWRYTRYVEKRLRRRYLQFVTDVRNYADGFLAASVPVDWLRGRRRRDGYGAGFVRVGVHVRRGDILKAEHVRYGFTTPEVGYYRRAMAYFAARYERVQFIVCSTDMAWSRRNIVAPMPPPPPTTSPDSASAALVNVTYCDGRSAGRDMAVLASCDHVIMSTGTFGWWAAWLAGGTTIFYRNWPRAGSILYTRFTYEDFFPPNWISME